MGWWHEDLGEAHEGWLGVRLGRDVPDPYAPDGCWPAGTVMGMTNAAVMAAGDGLVPACTCGWRGVPVDLAPAGDLYDLEKVHEDRGHAEWRVHIDRLLVDVPPGELLDDLDALLDRVGELVDARPLAALVLLRQATGRADRLAHQAAGVARAGGTTWEDIGRALGVSRQAAQERFTRRSPVVPAASA
ncbi:hypothetical protein [Parafrankia sp. FMc2]|uniref:hypothetical protein n=1 Tax=Parafrankia sp. FMc2 TaxID=3233196 RepID=UPI0034D5F0EF